MPADVEALWRHTIGHLLDGADAGATFRPTHGDAPITGDTLFPGPRGEPATAPFDHAGYVVGPEIGRGGMAVVHRARQTRLVRDVALKMAHDAGDVGARRRFVQEAQVTGRLEHPNIVAVHELAETRDGRLALAMKLLDGEPWSRALRRLDLVENVRILADVANAVAFAHDRGFAHCDLKPDNVMLGAFGEVVVMDWGCAVALRDPAPGEPAVARPAREVRHPFGTPAYMPPELAHGDGARIDAGTDVYLLGAILCEILTGRPPHARGSFAETLRAAAAGGIPSFPADAPTALVATCVRALGADRHAGASSFREALLAWLERRKSLALSDHAQERLARCADAPAGERDAQYVEISAAMAGFSESRRLWADNPDAIAGEDAARRLLVDRALANGDLGLAEAHAAGLADPTVHARIRDAVAQRSAARTSARRVRIGLGLALAALLVTAGVGLVAVNGERTVVAAKLAEIRRLADVQVLRQLEDASASLWPATPDRAPALRAWLGTADEVLGRLPEHRTRLSAAWDLDDPVARWEHDTLADLVAGLEALDPDDVRARLAFAETLRARSIDDVKPAWDAAIARVAANPAYRGLALAPQLGLVPLGPDPSSGLEEFAHLASGVPAVRDPAGRIAPTEAMGVVLVLLPGGTFSMGTSDGKVIEGPPHEVTLDPFFFGKYEVTQAQWVRATGANPSAYQPGRVIGGNTHTALHPAELVSWRAARDTTARLALTLPTEAQWEYATRAGTTTQFWTGEDFRTLQGAANIADRWGKTHGGPESWVWELDLDDGWLAHAPIGSLRPNPFGLHDTAGNVWEWCIDRQGAYTLPVRPGDGAREAPADAPQQFRGGGFRASRAHARSADRYPLVSTDFTSFDIGLRAARPLSP